MSCTISWDTLTNGTISAQYKFRLNNGQFPYAFGPDLFDEHNHPESEKTTIYYLGTGSPEFEVEVLCPSAVEFAKLVSLRGTPGVTVSGQTWIMTFQPRSAQVWESSGYHVVRARFKGV